jgi:two-component sensor histidine kinase
LARRHGDYMRSEAQAGGGSSKSRQRFVANGNEQAPATNPVSDTQLLLREFTHRINNELTSAICMIAVATMRSENRRVKHALSEVENRLRAYAEVNQTLRMPNHVTSVDVGTYLKKLCRAISRAKLDFREIELTFVERPFLMGSDRCWRLGLIVFELVTNSARHAFGEGGGSICVELVPLRSAIECHVSDNGRSEMTVGAGQGCQIIEALVRSLDGRITQHFGCSGSRSRVHIPLDGWASPTAFDGRPRGIAGLTPGEF